MQVQVPAKPAGSCSLTTACREGPPLDKRILSGCDKNYILDRVDTFPNAPSGSALASMCQFLSGFASYGSACAGALVVLETPQIIQSLERKYVSHWASAVLSPYPNIPDYDADKRTSSEFQHHQVHDAVKQLLDIIACKSSETNKQRENRQVSRSSGKTNGIQGASNPLQGDPTKQALIRNNEPKREDPTPPLGLPFSARKANTEKFVLAGDEHSFADFNSNAARSGTCGPGSLCRCGMIHTLRRSRKRPLHPLAHSPKSERLCSAPPPYLERVTAAEIESTSLSEAKTSSAAANKTCSQRIIHKNSPIAQFSSHGTGRASLRENRTTIKDTTGQLTPNMHVVYVGKSAAGRGLQSRVATPVPYTVPEGGLGYPFQNSLVFDASFESANLLSAVQRGPKEYDLFLRADLHTEGFTQWFYFAVTNTHTVEEVKIWRCSRSEQVSDPPTQHAALVTFNIVNLTKPDSLFNLGMQPVMYSCAEAVENGIGWVRTGTSVQYQANQYLRHPSGTSSSPVDAGMTYYTLSFTLAFYRPDDIYLIAHSYPYTYSDHKAHIANLLRSSRKRRVTRHSALCRTLDSHECDLMTITSNENDLRSNECNTTSMPYLTRRKKLIILSARVHPGETPASWMMRGILEFLTGESNDAKILRSLFIFKIVPMLNPDGVIYGNNRCSLSGVDLNRLVPM